MTRSSRKPDPELLLIDPTSEVHELRASRARLVAANFAGRRELERDLHDGVQQHLVALVVNLQLARQLADNDPPALAHLLEEIARDVRDALESARELAHHIYPALLLDRGLLEAISAAAAAIPARVEPAQLARYPEDLEATVYFCCIDALDDAAALTSGAPTVRLWQEGSTLNFEVDSPGPQQISNVSRLESMHDRIGAVGGRLSVVSTPEGGTRVSGTIPLAP